MLANGTLMAHCHSSIGKIPVENFLYFVFLTLSVMQYQESRQAARWRGEYFEFF